MTAGYAPEAKAAIQRVYDDPSLDQLAERIEEILDLLDTSPGDRRLHKNRMQEPKLWAVPVHGSSGDFVILWDLDDAGRPWVRYAGPAF